MSVARRIGLSVNGVRHEAETPVRQHLADFLRGTLGLTGTHLGCEYGVCGACTVLVDGLAVRACLMLAVQAEGCRVITVEGLAPSAGTLHPLQAAFCAHHGLQCGFCTPGMLTTLVEFLQACPAPRPEEVRLAISGNLCRCTGYDSIVAAAMEAARIMRESGRESGREAASEAAREAAREASA